MFVGRKKELELLEESYSSQQSSLVVLYGRRRIGKSRLIHHFVSEKSDAFLFEAVENQNTLAQIKHFAADLGRQTRDPFLSKVTFSSWDEIFDYFTEKIVKIKEREEKLIIFFDEIQWMAVNRGKLISILKYFYDNHWKEHNVMLILCGSIASFMITKIVNSNALYGRITTEIALQGLKPDEAVQFFDKRKSSDEIMRYLLVFGTVPKYLEQIRQDRSFHWNVNTLCFSSHAIMIKEVERIFYSHFRETEGYLSIVEYLREHIATHKEISKAVKIPSGGGLTRYLTTLTQAEIIRSFVPFGKKQTSTLRKYMLSDEFLIFYYKYMKENQDLIENSSVDDVFETVTAASFDVWLGFAFERFCMKHALFLASKMGFGRKVLTFGSYFEKKSEGFQIDLLYKRSDKIIVVCEIKYHSREISKKVLMEVEKKVVLLTIPRGYSVQTALISLYGPDSALRAAKGFDYYLSLDDIIS